VIQAASYCYAVFSKRSRMVVDSEGIDDRLTLYSMGNIPWRDVRSIEVKSFMGMQVLLIHIEDADARISEKAWWQRYSLNKANKRFGTPMLLSERMVDYNIGELAKELSERHEKAKLTG
jgi:hypothetical protein